MKISMLLFGISLYSINGHLNTKPISGYTEIAIYTFIFEKKNQLFSRFRDNYFRKVGGKNREHHETSATGFSYSRDVFAAPQH